MMSSHAALRSITDLTNLYSSSANSSISSSSLKKKITSPPASPTSKTRESFASMRSAAPPAVNIKSICIAFKTPTLHISPIPPQPTEIDTTLVLSQPSHIDDLDELTCSSEASQRDNTAIDASQVVTAADWGMIVTELIDRWDKPRPSRKNS